MPLPFESEIEFVVTQILETGTHEEIISLMETLRAQARRLDNKLANPSKWNMFDNKEKSGPQNV